jgi:hypothetical protein
MNWGVNFQAHCLELKPLIIIMVIHVIFKEMEINMGKNNKWKYIIFLYS